MIEKSYVPTLGLKPSEMTALQFLPEATHDRLMPLGLLAPWLSAKDLERGIERIEEAFPRGQYLLDLDDHYESSSTGPAHEVFESLFDASANYSNWWQFTSNFPRLIPCIKIEGLEASAIRRHVTEYLAASRPFAIRVSFGRQQQNLPDLVAALVDTAASGYCVVLDGGWMDDPLTFSAWSSGLISGLFAALPSKIPFIPSFTSMPRGFSDVEGVKRVSFDNRNVIQSLKARFPERTLVYGDWGSTKPRNYERASSPLPRVDYADSTSWTFARNKSKAWTYVEAAKAIISSPAWVSGLDVWGEYYILDTAKGGGLGITSPAKNVAARVNLHLHRQAFFGENVVGRKWEDEWRDD